LVLQYWDKIKTSRVAFYFLASLPHKFLEEDSRSTALFPTLFYSSDATDCSRLETASTRLTIQTNSWNNTFKAP